MRLAIIAHPLHAGGGISVGRNLIASIGKTAPEHDYFVSYPSGLGYEEVVASLSKAQPCPYQDRNSLIKRFLYEERQLKPALRDFKPDLILALANKGVGGFDCPEAILCHRPHIWYPTKNYGSLSLSALTRIYTKTVFQRFLLARSLRNPRNILLYQTKVAHTRIRKHFKSGNLSIHCPNAVSSFLESPLDRSSNSEIYSRYESKFKLFYLTRYYPHKNLEAIVETYREFSVQLSDTIVFITIDADQHPGAKCLLDKIERFGLNDQIVNVGPLPQENLGQWFNACDGLLMPTLLESFSGTYLEAMHFGLPILTSDLDFAHEVCGDAALYFDPWSTVSIAAAIDRIRHNPDLSAKMRESGKSRLDSMQVSWDEIASRILQELSVCLEKC